MRSAVFCLVLLAFAASHASPLSLEQARSQDLTDSKTFTALQRWMTPVIDWFRNTLPQKTPSELGNDMQNVASDAQEWAANNRVIQGLGNALQPIYTWVKDSGNVLKDKTFREMYDDTKDIAGKVDEQVGDWVDNMNQEQSPSETKWLFK